MACHTSRHRFPRLPHPVLRESVQTITTFDKLFHNQADGISVDDCHVLGNAATLLI